MAAWMLHGLYVAWSAGDVKGTSCVRRVRLRSFRTRLVPSMCFATSGCSCAVVPCVSWSCGCRSHCHGCMHVAWAICFGEEAGARNLVFFRVKWLQATMKGTSCVRRVRLRSFRTRLVPSMCFATSGCSCGVVLCVSWSCGCRSHCNGCMNVAWAMLWGGSGCMRNCVFLQATMKGTSCVRRVRLRSFRTRLVPSMCFATSGCSCGVVLCVSWSCGCRSHCHGCMNVAWSMFWGGSRSTKPCVFPCKVAAGDDERYLVCATGAAAVVPECSFYVFCNKWLFLWCSSMRFLKLWLQIAL